MQLQCRGPIPILKLVFNMWPMIVLLPYCVVLWLPLVQHEVWEACCGVSRLMRDTADGVNPAWPSIYHQS